MSQWHPDQTPPFASPSSPEDEEDEAELSSPDPFPDYKYNRTAGFRLGPEHPHRKGWFATDQFGKQGEPLWYKPPGFVSRWLYRLSAAILGLAALVGIGLTLAGL
jgi:hypothetical protein